VLQQLGARSVPGLGTLAIFTLRLNPATFKSQTQNHRRAMSSPRAPPRKKSKNARKTPLSPLTKFIKAHYRGKITRTLRCAFQKAYGVREALAIRLF
jgi:predicted RND superfamily exporter protein